MHVYVFSIALHSKFYKLADQMFFVFLQIVFDYPYEVLTHITGYYGTTLVMGPTAVKCIAFHTTKGKYGPFGQEQGMPFSSQKGEGMIVGFHGRKGWYIDGIGVHLLEGKIALPMPPPPPTNSNASNPGYQSDTFITEVIISYIILGCFLNILTQLKMLIEEIKVIDVLEKICITY